MNEGKRIALIVDDEEDICQLLGSYLRKNNYITHYALTLKDGLEKCESYTPDLIFLDNNLPDGTGISNISTFSNISPNSRIIVISAMTNLADKALSAGAVAFIAKPVSFNNLNRFL